MYILEITSTSFQKFEPLDELKQASLIILLSNFSSQTTFELVKILKERTLASNIEYDEVLDVAHSRKPPIGALLWNRNDFKGSILVYLFIRGVHFSKM